MNPRVGFNLYPSLQPDETVLLFKERLWLLSTKSLPSYRVFFSLPPLWEAALYITDRRMLVVANVFRLLSQEASQWRAGCAEPNAKDIISGLQLGQSSVFGPFLDVFSTTTQKRWLRSPELRFRLYMKDAELAYRLLAAHCA